MDDESADREPTLGDQRRLTLLRRIVKHRWDDQAAAWRRIELLVGVNDQVYVLQVRHQLAGETRPTVTKHYRSRVAWDVFNAMHACFTSGMLCGIREIDDMAAPAADPSGLFCYDIRMPVAEAHRSEHRRTMPRAA